MNMKKITLFLTAILISTAVFAADMSGIYKVGTAEVAPNFMSLSAAVAELNAANITGDITLEITSDITEPANIGLGVDTKGFGITIRPDADENRTITFTKLSDNLSPTGHLVIGYTDLTTTWADANTIATNKVTIDGYAMGGSTKRLKFTNANTTHGSRVIVVVGACQNTIIKNCIIENTTTSTSSPVGIVAVVRKGVAIEVAPANLTVENNTISCNISTVGMGIRITNSGTIASAKLSGFVCRNNEINAQRRILEINYTNGGEIDGNRISLVQPTSTALGYGIWTATGCSGTFNIYNNKFIAISCSGADAAAGGQRALSLGGTVNCNVYNNMFAGMNRAGTAAGAINQTYCFFGCTGKIYNNTFYMPALTIKTNSGYYSAIQLSSANPAISNNIFISEEDGIANAFYSAVSSGAVDNNIFFNRAGTTKSLIVSGTTNSTLALHQAANPTKDINSKSVNVNFMDAATGDLRITGASIGDQNLGVTRLAEVLKDIYGTDRATKTYAGAHEASNLLITDKVFTVTVPNGTEKVYLVGSFPNKNWDIANPHELTATANPNEFSGTFACDDALEYKYFCEKDWEFSEAVYGEGSNPPAARGNRTTYTTADVVPIWINVNKITLNVSFATSAVPLELFVKGGFNGWATPLAMNKSGNTYSLILGGNPGDKYAPNMEYKYYTNDGALNNWEADSEGNDKNNRWSIAPVMNDVIARFKTDIFTNNKNITTEARIMRTALGIEVSLSGEAKIELYNMKGMLLDSKTVTGSYSRNLDNGIYIIRINGKSTKFIK